MQFQSRLIDAEAPPRRDSAVGNLKQADPAAAAADRGRADAGDPAPLFFSLWLFVQRLQQNVFFCCNGWLGTHSRADLTVRANRIGRLGLERPNRCAGAPAQIAALFVFVLGRRPIFCSCEGKSLRHRCRFFCHRRSDQWRWQEDEETQTKLGGGMKKIGTKTTSCSIKSRDYLFLEILLFFS